MKKLLLAIFLVLPAFYSFSHHHEEENALYELKEEARFYEHILSILKNNENLENPLPRGLFFDIQGERMSDVGILPLIAQAMEAQFGDRLRNLKVRRAQKDPFFLRTWKSMKTFGKAQINRITEWVYDYHVIRNLPPLDAVKEVSKKISGAGLFTWEFAQEMGLEITARINRGIKERGALYIPVVLTTYPIYFAVTETAEHVVLGAPLGMACNVIQLGYFVVLDDYLMMPATQFCNAMTVNLEKEKGWSHYKKNFILWLRSFVKRAEEKNALKTVHIKDFFAQGTFDLMNGQKLKKVDFEKSDLALLNKLAKNPFIAPALHFLMYKDELSQSAAATSTQNKSQQFIALLKNQIEVFLPKSTNADEGLEKLRAGVIFSQHIGMLRSMERFFSLYVRALHEEEEINFKLYNSVNASLGNLSNALDRMTQTVRTLQETPKTKERRIKIARIKALYTKGFIKIFDTLLRFTRTHREADATKIRTLSLALKKDAKDFHNGKIEQTCEMRLNQKI